MQSRARAKVLPFVLALVAGVSLLVVAAAPDSVSAATTKTVSISGFSFAPATITVNVGDTVKWVHDASATGHSVTADNGSFDSSPSCSFSNSSACLGANATYSHTFNTAGTFRYYCRVHGGPGGTGMSGTVVVKAAVAKPTISSVMPATVKHGATGAILTVTGTNFKVGVKVKISGTGITIKALTRVSATKLTVKIAVASTAPKTARSVTVTNTDTGTATKLAAFKIV